MLALEAICGMLVELYGIDTGVVTFNRLTPLIERYRPVPSDRRRSGRGKLTQSDAILITYGDQILEPGIPPLRSLAEFCGIYLKNLVSGIHILPFFPYTSDDGFSVIDYKAVDPDVGSWDELAALRGSFRLMFDAVINHVSVQNEWFTAFLRGETEFSEYFIEVNGDPDLSSVVRPRTSPLLTSIKTPDGSKSIWTTFSADQVDLNYHNPNVLLNIIDILLYYASRGAEFLRLDAIAYLWKEIGTACIHLHQTHLIIQLFRAVLDEVFPEVLLISETNVSHPENISYFGDGTNEAQLVYNFALPPLVLHTLHTGSALALSEWASVLKLPSSDVTFFNFLASHDGIGVNPVRGILTINEIEALVAEIEAHGGLVSYKQNIDGTRSPYELNINYFDALSNPNIDEPVQVRVDRFMAAQAIMLALPGVPGIYFHSLFGSRGWPAGVRLTGRNRTINRQKLERRSLELELADPLSLRRRVFARYEQMLKARASSPAFHPNGSQEVLDGKAVFALLRLSPDGKQRVLCLHNVSNHLQPVPQNLKASLNLTTQKSVDLITGRPFQWDPVELGEMLPYQGYWLDIK